MPDASIESTIHTLRAEWSEPRTVLADGRVSPFPLVCRFDATPAGNEEPRLLAANLPGDLLTFWRAVRSASLFIDCKYGQWGIEMLAPPEVARFTATFIADRPADYRPGDLIIGWFRGDSDLLLLRCESGAADFGSVVVAGPIDGRKDWPTVAPSLSQFLARMLGCSGDKYWES